MIVLGLVLMLATRLLDLSSLVGATGVTLFLLGALPLLLTGTAQLELTQD